MYSTIYKIPKRSASIPYTYEPKLRFSQSYSLLLVFMVHGPFPVVNSATSFSGIDLNLREHRVKVSIF